MNHIIELLDRITDIVERRHREPIKFLFLPLGSQASTDQKSEQLFWAVFHVFIKFLKNDFTLYGPR